MSLRKLLSRPLDRLSLSLPELAFRTMISGVMLTMHDVTATISWQTTPRFTATTPKHSSFNISPLSRNVSLLPPPPPPLQQRYLARHSNLYESEQGRQRPRAIW